MQPQTNNNETQATNEQGTESLPTEYIDRKDKCKGIYKFPSAVVYDFNKYVLIKDEFEDVYRFSTVCGSYCCTFPYLFLNKYRNLFFPEIKYSYVLESIHAPPFTI